MGATPYRALTWSQSELLSEDKLDQLTNNTQWIFENTPRAVYTLPSGIRRAEGIKMACGRVVITARKTAMAGVNVNFTNLFSTGCEPIITTGVIAVGQRRIFHVLNGLGTKVQPDNRGFAVYVEVDGTAKKTDRIASNVYITWQAMGY